MLILQDKPISFPTLRIDILFSSGFNCAVAKPSGGFPLQYRPLIALLAFERGAVARMSRHDQANRLTVKRLGCVDSYFMSPSRVKYVLI